MIRPVFSIALVTGALVSGMMPTQAEPTPPTSQSSQRVEQQLMETENPLQDSTRNHKAINGEAGGNSDTPASEAKSLIGHPVVSDRGEHLGEVDTLLVTPDGQVASVVLGTGGLMGFGKDRYEIPWTQIQWRQGGQYLAVDTDKKNVPSAFSRFAFEPTRNE